MYRPSCFAPPGVPLGQRGFQGQPLSSRCVSQTPRYAAQAIGVPAVSSRVTMADSHGIPAVSGSSDQKVSRVRLTDIRKQMEFWFSSANLRRDWYLRRRMDDDGWIDPALFLNFNLIKRLNASVPEIIEACRQSSIVEVSIPNDTFGDAVSQTRIRKADGPLTPVEDGNLDEETARSIVVEKLPEDATCESIKDLFSKYGEVTYVWIPKKTGGTLRGYALVLYESASIATRAIAKFNEDQENKVVSTRMTARAKVDWEQSFTSKKISSTIIRLDGVSPRSSWRALWNVVQPRFVQADIQMTYLSFRHGDDHCYVTVRNEDDAKAALGTALVGVDVDGQILTPSILTDPEELDRYWATAAQKMAQRKRPLSTVSEETNAAFTPGIMVKIDGLPEGLYWRTVLDEVRARGDVVFLRYDQRTGSCYVRFATARAAIASVEVLDNSRLVDYEITAKVLEGEEEEQYWAEVKEWKRRSFSAEQPSEESDSSRELPDSNAASADEDMQRIFGSGQKSASQGPHSEEAGPPSEESLNGSDDRTVLEVSGTSMFESKSPEPVEHESATAA